VTGVDLVGALRSGDVRALARAISTVEEQAPSAVSLLQAAFPHAGCSTVVGITGAPGAGKSSLIDRLVSAYRAQDRRVGVVAVDPSSAFSGGAVLGDRVRMQRHGTDASVFIRSMATRGHLGGLARTTSDALDLVDAAGYDPIVVETVGVGQDEVEVVRAADVVVVVLVPGMGDDVQALKAGVLEIADLFVINKADRPGADRLTAELEMMLDLVEAGQRPRPAIVPTVAVRDEGTETLVAAIDAFLAAAAPARRDARRRERAEARLTALLGERLLRRVVERALPGAAFAELVDLVASRELDPYSAVERVLTRVEVR
jgi:LAO/AO transport system kinase